MSKKLKKQKNSFFNWLKATKENLILIGFGNKS